jgi:peroxiredoxin
MINDFILNWIMKISVCFAVVLLFAAPVFAQGDSSGNPNHAINHVTTRAMSRPLDTARVVYDEQGKTLHYNAYTKLVNTGDYGISRHGSPEDTAAKWYLKKLSPAEKEQGLARIKVFNAIKSPVLQEGMVLDVQPLVKESGEKVLDNKVVVLVFWNAWCPPCTESFSYINDIISRLKHPENIVMLAITSNSAQEAGKILKDKPLRYARTVSGAADVLKTYQLNRLPSYVITDKHHVIRFAVTGQSGQTMTAFEQALKQATDEDAIY